MAFGQMKTHFLYLIKIDGHWKPHCDVVCDLIRPTVSLPHCHISLRRLNCRLLKFFADQVKMKLHDLDSIYHNVEAFKWNPHLAFLKNGNVNT